MKNQENNENGHEDEIGAAIKDAHKKKEKPVDSFKTGDKKREKYFDLPFDEQMYDPDNSDNDKKA